MPTPKIKTGQQYTLPKMPGTTIQVTRVTQTRVYSAHVRPDGTLFRSEVLDNYQGHGIFAMMVQAGDYVLTKKAKRATLSAALTPQ